MYVYFYADYEKCTGVDQVKLIKRVQSKLVYVPCIYIQDPDRSCSPVDCAIKYKGERNFYRDTTGRCEPVVPCHTRGDDGVTIVAVSLLYKLGAIIQSQSMCVVL